MRQKKQMKMWGLLGLLAALPIISVWAGNNGSDESRKEKMVKSVSVIQPITGTWINLAYKDVRNKYTNPTVAYCSGNRNVRACFVPAGGGVTVCLF